MSDRRAVCPRCATLIRVTREELADKRGYCALCDTTFDITADRLDGDPMRASALVPVREAVRPLPAPPTSRVVPARAASGVQLSLRPQRLMGGLFGLFGLVWWSVLTSGKGPPAPMSLFFYLMGAMPFALTAWAFLGRERLRLADGLLVWTREVAGLVLQRRELATDGLTAEVATAPPINGKRPDQAIVLRIRQDGRIALDVGRALSLDAAEADWARAWLVDAVGRREPRQA